MSLKSRLKIENMGMFASSAFYAIVGIVCFITLGMIDFSLVHIGIIGTLSLMTAYGLFKRKVWAIWLVLMLFFIATTFSAYTLYTFGIYSLLGKDLLLDTSMIIYLVLTWVFTAYIAAKRKVLGS